MQQVVSKLLQSNLSFLSFIWMGNPLPKKFQQNIKNLLEYCNNFTPLFFGNGDSCQNKEVQTFCRQNKLFLLNLDKIFSSSSLFGLNQIIKKEKYHLPPNWAALSDIYRYLILYHFGGFYIDADVEHDKLFQNNQVFWLQELYDKSEDLAVVEIGNDILLSKKRNHPFWRSFLEVIKVNYPNAAATAQTMSNFISGFSLRHLTTLYSTGPEILRKYLQTHSFSYIASPYCSKASWKGYQWPYLDKIKNNKNIAQRAVFSILQKFKTTKSINLLEFYPILKNKTRKQQILLLLKKRLKKTLVAGISLIAGEPERGKIIKECGFTIDLHKQYAEEVLHLVQLLKINAKKQFFLRIKKRGSFLVQQYPLFKNLPSPSPEISKNEINHFMKLLINPEASRRIRQ